MKEKRNWNEFLDNAAEWSPHMSRREFLELAAASLALAGVTGCTRPPRDPIFPYVQRPEDSLPGKPTFFATARVLGGLATGILVETHLGRPTKIEGNPDHPASGGVAPAWLQASILSLYDPDRGQQVKFKEQNSSWDKFQNLWRELNPHFLSTKGEGLAFVTELSTSPTLQGFMVAMKKKFPKLLWIQQDPLFRSSSLQATEEVFGQALLPVYDFKASEVVVSFDADFLASPQFPVSYAKDFMERRRLRDQGLPLNQLFSFECGLSLTGLKANQRVALHSQDLEKVAEIILKFHKGPKLAPISKTSPSLQEEMIQQLLPLLQRKRGKCLFIAGPQQSKRIHAICHYLNSQLGKEVVRYVPAPFTNWESLPAKSAQLLRDLGNKKIQALFIFGANPVYSSPPEFKWQELIKNVEHSFRLGLYEDETAAACNWYLPQSDDFESWSDAQSFDTRVSILQPVIQPLYESRSAIELMHFLLNLKDNSSYELVQSFWKSKLKNSFESTWKESLRKGVLPDSGLHPPDHHLKKIKAPAVSNLSISSAWQTGLQTEIVWKESAKMYDGRFANNPWLQELPDPLSKVTWDNVAFVGSAQIQQRNIKNGQLLQIKVAGKTLRAPVWVLDGLPENTVVLSLGYGRTRAGKVGTHIGYNAYEIVNANSPDFSPGEIAVLEESVELACAQMIQEMENRSLIKTTQEVSPEVSLPSLYPKPTPEFSDTEEPAWAMVIDLDSCTGCAACVLACQSENNIPVVGKKGVLLGREMHWIRVDRYKEVGFQPVPCMHCEKAPCEPVCPVGATVHGNGGLNQMVYNRCVGTRYCSNNCPYKVRRFNFLHFAKFSPLEKLQKNPDVSIRPRGVMEKCTYCVQRINQVGIQAKIENRKIKDGEIQTACQQTCPTQAITFGDLGNPISQIRTLKRSPRNYSLLEELGTKPRTTYLAMLSKEELQKHD
ncbi:MAG: 4Fe-4S dicluster domain-containing protein [Pseudobdellovibrionaceae bacterium]